MLYYCKKCGRILQNNLEDPNYKCDCCKSITYAVPEKYWLNGLNFLINDKLENLLVEELVKTSPEFDQYVFDHRDEILAKQSTEFNAKIEHGRAVLEQTTRVPKCPTCQSTNIRKISGLESGASIAMFGLLSKKINKTFKCNNCGYTW